MNFNVKIVLVWIGVILVGAYKLSFPWAPFWVDLSVIGIAVLAFLFSRPEQVRPEDKKNASDDLTDKDDF